MLDTLTSYHAQRVTIDRQRINGEISQRVADAWVAELKHSHREELLRGVAERLGVTDSALQSAFVEILS